MSAALAGRPHGPIPHRCGIGLRAEHYRELLERRPSLAFIEVHSENYFGAGGAPLYFLEQARAHYPLSLHGVGLSLGSSDPLDHGHLRKLKALIQRFEPALVSDHLSWSSVGGVFLNDLLPLPYTEEALAHVASRVQQVQERLGRPILLENPSSYVAFEDSTLTEWEFLSELSRRSGCGLLLDVNNVYVSARNFGFDPIRYLDGIEGDRVGYFHLAGHSDKGRYLLDTHDGAVPAPVWDLYRAALRRFGRVPSLVEWDDRVPPLEEVVAESRRAAAIEAEELDTAPRRIAS